MKENATPLLQNVVPAQKCRLSWILGQMKGLCKEQRERKIICKEICFCHLKFGPYVAMKHERDFLPLQI